MTPKPGLTELENAQIDDLDLAVLAQLAEVHTILDPVPAGLTDRIKFGITLDALEAEVAELQRTGGLAGVRGEDTTGIQTITFSSSNLTTMVTITPTSADRVRIDGWLAPGAGFAVEIRTGDGQTSATVADEDGRFTFPEVPRGLAQFVLRPPEGTARPVVVTPSLQL